MTMRVQVKVGLRPPRPLEASHTLFVLASEEGYARLADWAHACGWGNQPQPLTASIERHFLLPSSLLQMLAELVRCALTEVWQQPLGVGPANVAVVGWEWRKASVARCLYATRCLFAMVGVPG
jgi:hypothetical protein